MAAHWGLAFWAIVSRCAGAWAGRCGSTCRSPGSPPSSFATTSSPDFPGRTSATRRRATLPWRSSPPSPASTGSPALVVLCNCARRTRGGARCGRRAHRPWAGTAVGDGPPRRRPWATGEPTSPSVREQMALAPRLRVGLVQANVNQSVKNERARYGDLVVGRLWPLTEEADRRGAALVAWPEAAWPWAVPPDLESFAGEGPGVAPLSRAHLLVGAGDHPLACNPRRRPGAPGGEQRIPRSRRTCTWSDRYVKHHLVPFGEYVPTWRLAAVPATGGAGDGACEPRAGPRAHGIRGRAGRGPDEVRAAHLLRRHLPRDLPRPSPGGAPSLLVNPTNDAWYGYSSGPHQFLAIVQMRAVEAGGRWRAPPTLAISAIMLPTGEVAPGALEVGPVDPEPAPDPDEPAATARRRAAALAGAHPLHYIRRPVRPGVRRVERRLAPRRDGAPPRRGTDGEKRRPAMATPTTDRLNDLASPAGGAPGVPLTSSASATGPPRSRGSARTPAFWNDNQRAQGLLKEKAQLEAAVAEFDGRCSCSRTPRRSTSSPRRLATRSRGPRPRRTPARWRRAGGGARVPADAVGAARRAPTPSSR